MKKEPYQKPTVQVVKLLLYLYILCAVLTLTACSEGGNDDGWQEPRNQANELYNSLQFEEALKLYEQAMDKADAEGRLTLRQDIIDCHTAMGEYTEARELLLTQMKEAHDAGDKYAEAEAANTLGHQLHDAGDRKKGYEYMLEAVRLMEELRKERNSRRSASGASGEGGSEAANALAYYQYVLMGLYSDDEDYAKSIAHSKAIGEVVPEIEDTLQGKKFLRMALALRAYCYLMTDSVAEAEQAYREWQRLLPCLNIVEERQIYPYYLESGHYREALELYSRYEPYVLDTKGRWSTSERVVCYNLAETYRLMGQYDSAYNRLMQAYEIVDTLNARQADANAQELKAVYQNQLKTEQISQLRLWVIVLGSVLAVLALIALAFYARHVLRRKNKAIIDVAKSLSAMTEDAGEGTDGQDSTETTRFAAFDRTVEQGRLYTQSDLSREMLADLMGVDRTTFSRIIQEQSGCKNLKDYLNQKRMRLAEQLLRKHPEYTIEAIAQDCGLGLSTFKRLCKDMHGMSPTDYRKSLQK